MEILIHLADFAIFDVIDGQGIIVDTREGRYLGLNTTATLLLSTSTNSSTDQELIETLRLEMKYDDSIIIHYLNKLKGQLQDYGVLGDNNTCK